MRQETQNQEFCAAFKAEMQQYVNDGFRANDCFPFVFADLTEKTGVPLADRAELREELSAWTAKII